MEYLSLQQGAEKVLNLSQRMLKTAEQGDWDGLGQLEQERSRSLEFLFQHPQMPIAMSTIAAILQQVVEIDRHCIALSEEARDAMAKELSDQIHGERAVRSYLEYQG